MHPRISRFPDGWPGLGLLLLRLAFVIALGEQGFALFVQSPEAGPRQWILAFLALVGAASFLLGLFTATGAAIVILGGLAAAFSSVTLHPWKPLEPRLAIIYVIAIAAAILLLGPGAFSLDAHIFGRREVVIPKRPSQ